MQSRVKTAENCACYASSRFCCTIQAAKVQQAFPYQCGLAGICCAVAPVAPKKHENVKRVIFYIQPGVSQRRRGRAACFHLQDTRRSFAFLPPLAGFG